MIGKTTIGRSFDGCVRYQFEGHKDSQAEKQAEVLEAIGVRADSADYMIADFNRGRRLNSALGRAVWHTSISFNPDDATKLTNEKMLAIAQDYLVGMGLDKTQYVVVRHHDTDHPHFHLIANRVGNDGKTISDSNNYSRSEKLLHDLSLKYGLTPVHSTSPTGKLLVKPKRRQLIKTDRLTPADQAKLKLYDLVLNALTTATSRDEVLSDLATYGVEHKIQLDSTGKEVGLSFTFGSYAFKASEIDRRFSLKGLTALIAKIQATKLARQSAPAPLGPRPTPAPTPVASQERPAQTWVAQMRAVLIKTAKSSKLEEGFVRKLRELGISRTRNAAGKYVYGDGKRGATAAELGFKPGELTGLIGHRHKGRRLG